MFLGPIWLIYRKMYLEGFLFLIINNIIYFIIYFITGSGEKLKEIIGRFSNIILCIIGNSLYHLKIYRVIKNMKDEEYLYNKNHILYLKEYGGTNKILAIVMYIIFIAITIIPIILKA